jgi:hypothetical protein
MPKADIKVFSNIPIILSARCIGEHAGLPDFNLFNLPKFTKLPLNYQTDPIYT